MLWVGVVCRCVCGMWYVYVYVLCVGVGGCVRCVLGCMYVYVCVCSRAAKGAMLKRRLWNLGGHDCF